MGGLALYLRNLEQKLEIEINKVKEAWGLNTKYPVVYPPGNEEAFLTDKEVDEFMRTEVLGVLEPTVYHAPSTLNHRFLTEEIPFGLVPLHHLGCLVGISTPYTDATVTMSGLLVEKDYWKEGITPEKLGWNGLSAVQILKML